MTVGAIIRRRWMLPQERPAFVGMTFVTGFVNGILDQQFLPRRAMRIVAGRTSDAACRNGMCGQIMCLRALRLVAGKAHLALGSFVQHLVVGLMNLMTRGAGDIATRMRTTRPVAALARRVAIQTVPCLHLGARFVGATVAVLDRRPFGGRAFVQHVRAAGTVTRLTTRLCGDAMTRAINRQDRFFSLASWQRVQT